MSEFFNEGHADKAIIASLLTTNRTLWEELEQKRAMVHFLEEQIKRSTEKDMSKLIQAENGVLLVAEKVEELTLEAAKELLDHLRSEVAVLEGFMASRSVENAPADHPPAPTEPETPAQPEQPAPVDQPAQPAQPEQPVPTDGQATPADSSAEATPAAPEQPVVPAVDPNAVPAAPEAPVIPPTPDQPAAPADPAPVDPSALPPLQ